MTKWKRANPNGTRDYLFEECTLIEEVEQKLRRTFLERGYEEIRTPTIEFYDVFAFQNRPIDEEKMYKFFDEKGRMSLCLENIMKLYKVVLKLSGLIM